MSEELSISECVNELRKFSNIFAAAHRLESIFEKLQGIEAVTARLTAAQRDASTATDNAKKELLNLQQKIIEGRREVELAAEQKSNRIDEGTQRAQDSLQTVKQELERTRTMAAQQKKQLGRDINDLHATREQLKRDIIKLNANKHDLEGGAKRIQDDAIQANERINQDKRSLEREVGDLQARKLTLNHEVKRLEALVEEHQTRQRLSRQSAQA